MARTRHAIIGAFCGALLLASFGIPATTWAADAVEAGRVTAVEGTATAQRAGEAARVLECGDAVYEGDRLVTEEGASLGMLIGDVLAHMQQGSQLELDRTAELTPDVRLEKGGVRLIDPRDTGALGYLAALDARAEIMGNDVEAYIFSEKVGPYAMLCEWDAPLRVSRDDQRSVASPGNCVIAKSSEPLYIAKAHDQRIPALADQVCGIDPGALAALAGDPTQHLSPAAVSAAGALAGTSSAGFASGVPSATGPITTASCDAPGSGCATPIGTGADAPIPGLPPFP